MIFVAIWRADERAGIFLRVSGPVQITCEWRGQTLSYNLYVGNRRIIVPERIVDALRPLPWGVAAQTRASHLLLELCDGNGAVIYRDPKYVPPQ